MERCLACEADRSEPFGGARLLCGPCTKPAPRNELDAQRCIRPENSPSRGSEMSHRIKREQLIDPRLGERLGVATRSKPSEPVTFGKILRSFGSLAPPKVPDRSASQARQRSTKANLTFHFSPLTAHPPGSWILAPDSSLFATFPRNAVYCR